MEAVSELYHRTRKQVDGNGAFPVIETTMQYVRYFKSAESRNFLNLGGNTDIVRPKHYA